MIGTREIKSGLNLSRDFDMMWAARECVNTPGDHFITAPCLEGWAMPPDPIPTPKVCLVCGVSIPSKINHGKPQKTCSPMCRGLLRKSLAEATKRFWPRVNKTPRCWLWTGPCGGNNNYGLTHYQGRSIAAHRFSWIIHRGPIPDGLNVLHRCDTPACVNPDHLFLGTHQDNMQDMVAKCRSAHGERCGNAKLSAEKVREMRRLRATTDMTERELAARFGVNVATAHRALTGEQWAHISEEKPGDDLPLFAGLEDDV